MNSVKFLFAAYVATWAIHLFYIGTLVRRFSRLRQQLRELGKGK
jgi:CcmD family protein